MMRQKAPEACSCDVRGVKMVFWGQESRLLTFPKSKRLLALPEDGGSRRVKRKTKLMIEEARVVVPVGSIRVAASEMD